MCPRRSDSLGRAAEVEAAQRAVVVDQDLICRVKIFSVSQLIIIVYVFFPRTVCLPAIPTTTITTKTLTQIELGGNHGGASPVIGIAAAAGQVEVIPAGGEERYGGAVDDCEGGVVGGLQDVAPGYSAASTAGGVTSATGGRRGG